ncbi:histidine kinase [Litoribacter ruber]|uniref:histidine kinase n=1 Tax=Litoribacter ruber TaxID=702568 RepID=UPI001BD9D211|nr:histidine kinase [Litoribacter ruber]MBT0812998.1 histidine kinase [Litoribacter ruber]
MDLINGISSRSVNYGFHRVNDMLYLLYVKFWYLHILGWMFYIVSSYLSTPYFGEEYLPFDYVLLNLAFLFVFFYGISFIVFIWLCVRCPPLKKLYGTIIFYTIFIMSKVWVDQICLGLEEGFWALCVHEYWRFQQLVGWAGGITLAVIIFVADYHMAEMIEERKRIEIDLLCSRLDPHFIFNSLQSFGAELLPFSERLYKKMTNLAGIFRYAVEAQGHQSYLWHEIKLVKKLIKTARYAQRGTLYINLVNGVDKDLSKQLFFPKRVLPTLVENVFKHGLLSDPADRAHISISCNIEEEWDSVLQIGITNKLKQGQKHKSFYLGLKACRKILQYHFKENFRLNERVENDLYVLDLIIYYGKGDEGRDS